MDKQKLIISGIELAINNLNEALEYAKMEKYFDAECVMYDALICGDFLKEAFYLMEYGGPLKEWEETKEKLNRSLIFCAATDFL